MTELKLEINERFVKAKDGFVTPSGCGVVITPPLDEKYWMFRVKLCKDQSIVAFPKFNTYGIGFAIEDDWNTNLPWRSPTEEIYGHIRRNKKYDEITKDDCIKAIDMLRKACHEADKKK